jgi:RNA polymerase sigma-70 factor (ECF subfamily)
MQVVPATIVISAEDQRTVEALRAGDEGAFTTLVDRHHAAMMRLAAAYLGDRSLAEEVTQEAWIRVLRGIRGFEGRSSLKTWIFHILVNCARSRAQRERRDVPFSALSLNEEADDLASDGEHLLPADAPRHAGTWASPPRPWDTIPEERMLSRETRERIAAAIAELPERQRTVIALRDIDGWSPEEVCNLLALSESNQRVLLHRARAHVRRALEEYFAEGQ